MVDRSHDFGLSRERKIIRAKVREVFTPHRPVQSADLFFGRKEQVRQLIEHVNTPGQHALLYGDRGVGKSSLANISAHFLVEMMGGKMYWKRCDSTDTFVTVLAGPLAAVGQDIDVRTSEQTKKDGGDAKFGIPTLFTGGFTNETLSKTTQQGSREKAESPGWVAETIGRQTALLVVDEADALSSERDRHKLAELMKHLSDAGSPFKILAVGIADTGAALLGGHASVSRCLKETQLERMSPGEVLEIIKKGAATLKLSFDPRVVDSIVELSAGYPHFTHLLGLKCAEEAVGDGRVTISQSDLERALHSAATDAEGTLKRAYEQAVRSYQTDRYKELLVAAACFGGVDFTASEWRQKLLEIFGIEIRQQGLNNYFERLVSDDKTTIIRRVSKGVYRFNDPRMPSYIRIAEGQLKTGR